MSFFLNPYSIYDTSSLDSPSDPYWNNVSLLLHGDGIGATPNGQQNNTFLDSSTNNFTITRNGTPTQGSFSPYALNGVAYSPTLHGGSAYFPGTVNNYLTLPKTAFTSIAETTRYWTLEGWFNFEELSSTTYSGCFNVSDYMFLLVRSTSIDFMYGIYAPRVNMSVTQSFATNTWYHIAVSCNNGTITLYVNGSAVGSVNTNPQINSGQVSSYFYIGAADNYPFYGTLDWPFKGYISGLRISNIAVYTSNFTPPTSPVTLLSNGGATPSTAPTSGQVSLLCDFTNGGIFDNTKKNVLTTVGNANVSTSIVKFGSGSMAFDGTGDYLTIPSSSNFAFGTGDFTVEFWMYPTANTPWLSLCGTQPGAITDSRGWSLSITNGSPEIAFWSSTKFIPAAITLNQWTHVSVTRSGTTLRMFINGTIANSTTNSENFTFDQLGVGCTGVGIQPYNGYIDDIRITKGIARYTSAFTPPTRAFADK